MNNPKNENENEQQSNTKPVSGLMVLARFLTRIGIASALIAFAFIAVAQSRVEGHDAKMNAPGPYVFYVLLFGVGATIVGKSLSSALNNKGQ